MEKDFLQKKKFFNWKIFFITFCFLIFILYLFFNFYIIAPKAFVEEKIFSIDTGDTLRKVSFKLYEEEIIQSRVLFETFVIIYGGENKILPGDYLFEPNLKVFEIAQRVAQGRKNLSPIKVTIPEGFNVFEIAELFDVKLPLFHKDNFLSSAINFEGKLFPDTYFFFRKDNEEKVLNTMLENYEKRISPLRDEIEKFGKNEKEIIIMASLIEGEASGRGDRELISGILWKRLQIGMLLQVDVARVTYREKGLPEKPISNPGLLAILASIRPEYSNYLFYIHGKDGNTYFAKTYDEHKRNIDLYLR